MSFSFDTLKLKIIDNNILLVEFNRPESCNAINYMMLTELHKFWTETLLTLQDVRCIILTGVGNKSFCSGADLKERNSISIEEWLKRHNIMQQIMRSLIDCTIPVLAAVNGVAYGGGLEICLACDFAYASENAIFSQSEVKVGIMPGAMGSQLLPRHCGLSRAKELTYTASSFNAQQAYEWGIINKICSPDLLKEEIIACANKIVANAPLAIKQVKKALNISQEIGPRLGFSYETEIYHKLIDTVDRKEGIQAFMEKRKPEFIGR